MPIQTFLKPAEDRDSSQQTVLILRSESGCRQSVTYGGAAN